LGVCDTTDLLSDVKPNREGNYYLTDRQNKPEMLPDTRWADWDNNGRLLIATHSGRLQVHDITRKQSKLIWERDLNGLTPEPAHSPDWAQT
jgi:hypothetical protein